MILDYRHAHKIKSTYTDGILAHVINKKSISTTWEQCAAATGRITSSGPNLQSIPKQEENLTIAGESFNLRKIFVSRLGRKFVAADFQQIELRVFAHLSLDKSLISAFQEPGDIFHTMTKIRTGKSDFDPSERERTKTLMYALLYGAGSYKISELLSVDLEHAKRFCCDFYTSFPGLKSFRARVLEECRTRKELRSLSGRRRLFPHIASQNLQQKRYSERQAVNFVIQGSAADISKAAMLRAEAALRERHLQAYLLLQIHDELLWEVPEEHVMPAIEIIKKAIEETKDYWSVKFNLKVNLPVKITSGSSWGNMRCEAQPGK
ncbi:hypothetical protein GE061_007345 [Apolygus lucorum]|uniref:DNA-directed DNA polymerase family A palm domain-containing protein n=1 Tax=Apolygus lucorum TaxID=248454 RepID=A0A8S9WSZ6_APOLU|nr:hypothetical protein GE061_007345 [Apolygus lucorum]